MNKLELKVEDLTPLANSIKEIVELFQAIKKARADGNVGWVEGIKIGLEFIDVIKSVPALKDLDVSAITNEEIEYVSELVMQLFDKEVKFTALTVTRIFRMAREGSLVIIELKD